jgi:hypothetical protein
LWEWFGGQHRKLACEFELERLDNIHNAILQQIEHLNSKPLELDHGAEIRVLERDLAAIKTKLEEHPWWGVLIIDRSKSRY